VVWLWLGLAALLLAILLPPLVLHVIIIKNYLHFLVRIFQEKPLFIIPRGQPVPDAEQVAFPTTNNLTLQGCYLKTPHPRKGVILFGLEFGSNRWACVPYCEFLREHGYDIFSFEMRGQGQSPSHEGYDPLQWLTHFEVDDFRAALAYLKSRPDVDPRGIGFFGLSKGGSAGLYVACDDPFIRCCVTDGIFATHTTMVPYMRKWIFIYSWRPWLAKMLPKAYYAYVAYLGLSQTEKERHCKFPHLEWRLRRLKPRPLLMIHGGADTYIKPEMAQALFDLVRSPKELWLVEGAKHNQAFHLANSEYKERVLAFFDKHLAGMAKTDAAANPAA
jgi:pimeloyl-ACP methyl ester carboxylesterase